MILSVFKCVIIVHTTKLFTKDDKPLTNSCYEGIMIRSTNKQLCFDLLAHPVLPILECTSDEEPISIYYLLSLNFMSEKISWNDITDVFLKPS
jgi:hypothetical protein